MTNTRFAGLIAGISTIQDTDQLEKYSTDSSGYEAASPSIVIRPATVEEVVRVVKACAECDLSYTVQGGLTGLAGGARPDSGDVVINLERLNQIEEIDSVGGTAIVQAGVVLENLHEAVAEQGWYFPLD